MTVVSMVARNTCAFVRRNTAFNTGDTNALAALPTYRAQAVADKRRIRTNTRPDESFAYTGNPKNMWVTEQSGETPGPNSPFA